MRNSKGYFNSRFSEKIRIFTGKRKPKLSLVPESTPELKGSLLQSFKNP